MIAFLRFVFVTSAALLSLVAATLFFTIITANGITNFHLVQTVLLLVCCGWLAWGFMTASFGMVSAANSRRRPLRAEHRPRGITAILVPVYNEDARSVYARIAAMAEGLRGIGRLDHFHFYVLSDSTKPESVAAEERGYRILLKELRLAGRIYYRNRKQNTGRKAGNIADFVTNHGGAYPYMLVLDADSLMAPETIVEMVARMDDQEDLALLQSQPLIINRRTIFGRALQFSAAIFSPVFSRGLAALQGREGPFWGHNAMIRTRVFAAHCGLPGLSGKPPFGGHILSHDYVEAALLARAGYAVRVDPDLPGSFEEAPANVIEYAKRDRRWCQGNLQHGRLLNVGGLKRWNRVQLMAGIMAYLASPIWLMFLIVSLIAPIVAPEPNYFPADSLFPVFPKPETQKALGLLFGIFVLLLLPKTVITFTSAFSRRRHAFGGTFCVIASATAELILTSLLAPITMMMQSKAIGEILIGADSGWPATDREDQGLSLKTAFSASWWMVAAGAAVLYAAYAYAPEVLLWTLPIAVPLLIAPLLISFTSHPGVGDLVRRIGLFRTPFEIDPHPVIVAADGWRERLGDIEHPNAPKKALIDAASDGNAHPVAGSSDVPKSR
ncbi:glucans biosynthesis glucosyltransferase MdoH [Fulvimarina sp. 2208YS6-2-32]|uniref:Glucans biosynthesis glucosyltransferase H n=1 Tax=Fulvimarina uroteuthidis TaxID=3098149 RepID=A0ABU5I7T8_9HYPH|nr:glucans biosynthesis glucosyltransferase MdoH [Fulvimarina sp. 2208YS6-2-32]MDY8111003.1 glucans biosynthesis glucosyltransferase MdoH [Fulvimarina sp. 2208YS6-2-32]